MPPMARTLHETGFHTLAGAPDRPAALVDEVRDAERLADQPGVNGPTS